MPTEQIVQLLIQERDRLNRAIEALAGPMKRRGRPPKNLALPSGGTGVNGGEPPKKRGWSPAQRQEAALSAKRMWAKRKRSGK